MQNNDAASDNDSMQKFTVVRDLYTSKGLTRPEHAVEMKLAPLVRLQQDHMIPVRATVPLEETTIVHPFAEFATSSNAALPGIPNLTEYIGHGTHGRIYSMPSTSESLDVAVKLQLHSSGDTVQLDFHDQNVPMNAFDVEVDLQLLASALGFAPAVYNAFTALLQSNWSKNVEQQHDVLIMDILSDTLYDRVISDRSYSGSQQRSVLDVVNAMHAADIFHGDLHGGNVMVDASGTPCIIDFGKSKLMTHMTEQQRLWCRLHDLTLLASQVHSKSVVAAQLRKAARSLSPNLTVGSTVFSL
jgi:Protein kinase domain